jgi:hypothetical protein
MSDRRFYPNPGPLFGGPIYPGNGYPPRPGEDRPGLSPFGRLAMGETLGKSSILIYDAQVDAIQQAPVDMITVEGDDADAWQLLLTLHPPRVVPLPFEEIRSILDQQNVTGEQTNSEVTAELFPGTKKRIQWPPLEAIIEFGTGGVSTKVVVDYLNGVTLSVVASYLRVHALVSQSKKSGDIFGTSAAYYLAAHVGPGFAVPHVQRTIFVGELNDDRESDVFDVPKFAKIATLIGTRTGHKDPHKAPSLTVGWIRFFQSPDGTNGVGDLFVPGTGINTFEIPNAAQYFSVFNQSGHEMKMSVVFELAL